MNVEIYINNERADYSDKINVQYAIDDIKNINSGRNNKSFEISLPSTDLNRKIFKFIDSVSVFDELEADGYISVDGVIIIQGRMILKSVTNKAFNIIITAEDWLQAIEGKSLKDLDLSALDHVYNAANIIASWPATGAYYYPLINFGKLSDPDASTIGEVDANMLVQDFYPAFRLEEILKKILEPWTVSSGLLGAGNTFRDYFLLSAPAVKDDDFFQNKDFEAYVGDYQDNYDIVEIDPTDTDSAEVDKTTYATRCDIDDETTDIGNNYAADSYTVPEAGTYRFVAEMESHWVYNGLGLPNSQEATYKIMRRRASADTELATFTTTDRDEFGYAQTLDTGYIHCLANDEIWISLYLTMEYTNTDVATKSLEIFLGEGTNTTIIPRVYNIFDEWCLFPADGLTVDTEAWLPDILQTDFLKAVKQMFNLRFAIDRNAGTIRMEAHDDFYTSNERDWTAYMDHSEVEQEMISIEYASIQRFRYKDDSDDFGLKAYIEDNAARPSDHDHTLLSIWTKDGVEERVNEAFADISVGKFRPLGWWFTDIIRIWGEGEPPSDGWFPFPQSRIRSWGPRLLYADGPTARPANFYFEGTNYANYPKATMTSWNTLFNDYHINAWHLIDAGKVVIIEAAIPASEIQRFATTVGTETTEGFRARYKVKIGSDTFMATVNRIVYNGTLAKVELLILR